MSNDFDVTQYSGLQLAERPDLDGGGRRFGRDFAPLVGHLFGRVGRLFEFCAGPGYIGFHLLARGHCDELVLADVNPDAVAASRETVRLNGLEDRVTVYQSDGLDDIPAHERWDLVVSNPPHFDEQGGGNPSLVLHDPGWELHRRFYAQVGAHLAPGGSLLIQENSEGSGPEDFLPMIADSGLTHVRTVWYTGGRPEPQFYYLWVKQGLPGLTFHDEPVAVTVPLRDSDPVSTSVPAHRVCVLRVSNETERPIRTQVVNEEGRSLRWPAVDVAPGAQADLPLIALSARIYEVRDEASGAVVARLLAG